MHIYTMIFFYGYDQVDPIIILETQVRHKSGCSERQVIFYGWIDMHSFGVIQRFAAT